MPLNRINCPMNVSPGRCQMVLATMMAQDSTKIAVVYGWPGVR